jgi:hypothetical protein
MAEHKLEIAEQANGKLAPTTGRRKGVRTGDMVTITPEKGATKLHIEFPGPSPFEGKVRYNDPMKVVATHTKGGGESANVFTYNCRFEKNGRPFESDGGGDIEILPSEG